GINTGPVVVGNMGSDLHFNYSFFGDAGNLAARLEGINKQFGTHLMISEYTLKQCEAEFHTRELSNLTVVGKSEPVRVYEPIAEEIFPSKQPDVERFDHALQAFYAGRFEEALKAFEELAERDPAAASYIPRCQKLMDEPADDWNGVLSITEK
ncbi:MAG: adenylate/guanylate cyclase domain-containing protein, partial [Verrucomicrobiota bacterium]